MSSLLLGAGPVAAYIERDDKRGYSIEFRHEIDFRDFSDLDPGNFANHWWPGSSRLEGEATGDILHYDAYYVRDPPGGASSAYGLAGVTRDVYGTPLGGVTVKLFRSSTDEKVSQTISDASGKYFVTTQYYPDAHYLVTYKTGSPDVFGTSENTLIGG